jgi:hypothetical protein
MPSFCEAVARRYWILPRSLFAEKSEQSLRSGVKVWSLVVSHLSLLRMGHPLWWRFLTIQIAARLRCAPVGMTRVLNIRSLTFSYLFS